MDRIWPKEACWTEDDVSHTGYGNREQMDFLIARAMSYLTDPERSKRREAGLCVYCFYRGSQMTGQAFTKWNCRACLQDQGMWPNTGTPMICNFCSDKHKLCKSCGADLFLRVKRSNVLLLKGSAGVTND